MNRAKKEELEKKKEELEKKKEELEKKKEELEKKKEELEKKKEELKEKKKFYEHEKKTYQMFLGVIIGFAVGTCLCLIDQPPTPKVWVRPLAGRPLCGCALRGDQLEE